MFVHSSRYHLAIFSWFSLRASIAAASCFWLLCCFALCSACATAPQLRTTAPLAAGTNTELAVGVVGAGGFAQIGGGGALAGRFRIDDRSELTFSANAVADVGWRDLSEGPEPLIPLRTGYRGLLYSGTVAMRYNFTKIDDTYFGGEVGINFFDDTGASLNRYQIGGQIGLPLLVDLYGTGIFVYALPTLGAVVPLYKAANALEPFFGFLEMPVGLTVPFAWDPRAIKKDQTLIVEFGLFQPFMYSQSPAGGYLSVGLSSQF